MTQHLSLGTILEQFNESGKPSKHQMNLLVRKFEDLLKENNLKSIEQYHLPLRIAIEFFSNQEFSSDIEKNLKSNADTFLKDRFPPEDFNKCTEKNKWIDKEKSVKTENIWESLMVIVYRTHFVGAPDLCSKYIAILKKNLTDSLHSIDPEYDVHRVLSYLARTCDSQIHEDTPTWSDYFREAKKILQ